MIVTHPLYNISPIQWPDTFPQGGHAGLWFDRFFNKYDTDWQVPRDGKLAWIKTVCGDPVGDANAVKIHTLRLMNLIKGLGGETICAKTDWHFATGLGNNHPVENGFAWHPTLGVPYLTGAAVKGLLRSWCEVWSDTFVQAGEDRPAKLRLWFGPSLDELNPKKGSTIQKPAAGELIFFDALPVGPVKLKPDVMTPHMGKWYEEGDKPSATDGSNLPADWHSPVPVPFLVVDKNQVFQFAIACRSTAVSGGIKLDDVIRELSLALKYLGAGAKTAAGYGHMQHDTKSESSLKQLQQEKEEVEAQAQIEREKKERRATMSPLESELDEWSSLPQQRAEEKAVTYMKRMVDPSLAPEDRRIIAGALKAFYKKYGRWDGGSKELSNKQKEKIRQIKEALDV